MDVNQLPDRGYYIAPDNPKIVIELNNDGAQRTFAVCDDDKEAQYIVDEENGKLELTDADLEALYKIINI